MGSTTRTASPAVAVMHPATPACNSQSKSPGSKCQKLPQEQTSAPQSRDLDATACVCLASIDRKLDEVLMILSSTISWQSTSKSLVEPDAKLQHLDQTDSSFVAEPELSCPCLHTFCAKLDETHPALIPLSSTRSQTSMQTPAPSDSFERSDYFGTKTSTSFEDSTLEDVCQTPSPVQESIAGSLSCQSSERSTVSSDHQDAAGARTHVHSNCTQVGQRVQTLRSFDSVNRLQKIKNQSWQFLDNPESSVYAWLCTVLLRCFILASVSVTLLQTSQKPVLSANSEAMVEITFSSVFLLELVVRFGACPSKRKFLCNPFNLLDVAAVVPSLILRLCFRFQMPEDGLDTNHSVIRAFVVGVIPMLRLLRMLRYMEKVYLIIETCKVILEAIPTMLFCMLIMAWFFAALIFAVEPRTNVPTFGTSLWLTIVTMTTVGYGDITPIHPVGSVIVSVLVVTGVLYIAMPIGIIGGEIQEVWRNRDRILLMQRARSRLASSGYSPHDIPSMFHTFDTSGRGALDLRTFKDMMKAMEIGLQDERVIQLFESFEVDSCGTIDCPEFMKHLFPGIYYEHYCNPDVSSSAAICVSDS